MPLPNKPPKYDGPFEDQEEEDAALLRYMRLRQREAELRSEADEEEKKKKKKLLPFVD